MKVAPARTRATSFGPLTERQRSCAASSSLKAIARPASREPGPLVTLVRSRTVANVELIGSVVLKCSQCRPGSRKTSAADRDVGDVRSAAFGHFERNSASKAFAAAWAWSLSSASLS